MNLKQYLNLDKSLDFLKLDLEFYKKKVIIFLNYVCGMKLELILSYNKFLKFIILF